MWWTAILMGLAGSFHCAGMCSPLVMAATARNPFLLSKVIYNSGRVLVYGSLGAFAGQMGSLLDINQQQTILSISLGFILILIGVGLIKSVRIPFFNGMVNQFISLLKFYFGKVLSLKGSWTTFILGSLNGLLPCGLTYLALSYCLVLPSANAGFLFMLLFGLGTWPVMIGLTWIVRASTIKLIFSYHRISMAVLFISGFLLIGRGVFEHHHANRSEFKSATPTEIVECK